MLPCATDLEGELTEDIRGFLLEVVRRNITRWPGRVLKVALRPHSAQKTVTYFPAYFVELRHILPHCSIYSYYNSYLDS